MARALPKPGPRSSREYAQKADYEALALRDKIAPLNRTGVEEQIQSIFPGLSKSDAVMIAALVFVKPEPRRAMIRELNVGGIKELYALAATDPVANYLAKKFPYDVLAVDISKVKAGKKNKLP